MHENIRNIPFELKELSDAGDFVGLASFYGNVDLGGDIVERNAFDKSIAEHGNKVRLMDGHRVRIGMATVESTPIGLKAIGKINTKKQSGAEALSDLKFYRDNGLPMGMSIGYETVKADVKGGVRHLEQLRLWEVTVTEFPMNERAQVTSVKSIRDLIASIKSAQIEKKDDFNVALQKIQLMAARYQMLSALSWALDDALYAEDGGDPVSESADSIAQFQTEYMAMLPDFVALRSENAMGWMSLPAFEKKAGRVLSQSNRELITKCITDLQALLDSADADKSASRNADDPTGSAEHKSEQTTNHSEVLVLIDNIRTLIPKQ